MIKGINYAPENPTEELFELVGRVNAFAAYVNTTKWSIERELCAEMLGFELTKEEPQKEE